MSNNTQVMNKAIRAADALACVRVAVAGLAATVFATLSTKTTTTTTTTKTTFGV